MKLKCYMASVLLVKMPERERRMEGQPMFAVGVRESCVLAEIIARYEKLTVIYAIMLTKYLLAHY